ncbi:MAG: hypothetical protein AAGC85_22750 [Bacteroidota bacterium]
MPVIAQIIIFGALGATAILYTIFSFAYKIEKAKSKADVAESDVVKGLVEENKQLRTNQSKMLKRIESLEAIIVDNDMLNLETGLSSRMEEEKESYSQSRKQPGIEELL